jgi:hypothetical protein
MPRKRVLSHEGCRLFNVSLYNNPPPQYQGCLRRLFLNLLTSDFDHKLADNSKQMRQSTCKLYSYLDKREQIPSFINNAITNIVLLILLNDSKINKLHQVKYNIHYYITLAKKAHDSGDHQTAILITAALKNTALTNLQLKNSKKDKNILIELEKEYGNFMNCHSGHLKQMLKNKETICHLKDFLPSIMILLMHLNRTKEYVKGYTNIGKFPKSLILKEDQLQLIANNYFNEYKNIENNLVQLYEEDPLNNDIMNQMKSEGIASKLHEISNIVKSVKRK